MADEVSIYHDGNIQITNLRAILHGKTYAMANITSVALYTQVNSRLPGFVVLAFGVLTFLIGVVVSDARGCFVVVGLLFAGVGVAYIVAVKNVYWIRIGSASGEANALKSHDHQYIRRIVDAMNAAIVRRG